MSLGLTDLSGSLVEIAFSSEHPKTKIEKVSSDTKTSGMSDSIVSFQSDDSDSEIEEAIVVARPGALPEKYTKVLQDALVSAERRLAKVIAMMKKDGYTVPEFIVAQLEKVKRDEEARRVRAESRESAKPVFTKIRQEGAIASALAVEHKHKHRKGYGRGGGGGHYQPAVQMKSDHTIGELPALKALLEAEKAEAEAEKAKAELEKAKILADAWTRAQTQRNAKRLIAIRETLSAEVCRHGARCNRGACKSKHPRHRYEQECTYGEECRNPECLFVHPKEWQACRFGDKCKKPDCTWMHPIFIVAPAVPVAEFVAPVSKPDFVALPTRSVDDVSDDDLFGAKTARPVRSWTAPALREAPVAQPLATIMEEKESAPEDAWGTFESARPPVAYRPGYEDDADYMDSQRGEERRQELHDAWERGMGRLEREYARLAHEEAVAKAQHEERFSRALPASIGFQRREKMAYV